MSHIPSDAELREELLTKIVNQPATRALMDLSPHDLHAVLEARRDYDNLILGIAVKIESGVKPKVRK